MLQTGEIIIIAILALVVLGPTRLPEMARKIGGWTSELRRAAREITAGLEAEISDFKEVGKELKGPIDEVRKPFNEIGTQLGEAGRGYDWKGPKPLSGPTPADAMRDLEEMNTPNDQAEAPADEAEAPPATQPEEIIEPDGSSG